MKENNRNFASGFIVMIIGVIIGLGLMKLNLIALGWESINRETINTEIALIPYYQEDIEPLNCYLSQKYSKEIIVYSFEYEVSGYYVIKFYMKGQDMWVRKHIDSFGQNNMENVHIYDENLNYLALETILRKEMRKKE